MRRSQFRSELRRYGADRVLELKRRCASDTVSGFVVGFSDSLLLLHSFDWDCFTLNGYTAVRDHDIRTYRFVGSPKSWQARALRHFRISPEAPTGVSVLSMHDLLETAARRFPLLTVHQEYIEDDVCYIGPVISLSDRSLVIEKLDADGVWAGPRRFLLSNITCVDFGEGTKPHWR